MKSNGIRISILVLTLLNGVFLFHNVRTYSDWVTPVFLALAFELLVGIFYLQYRVYLANSKSNPASIQAQLKNLKQQSESIYNRMDALLSIHSVLKFRRPLPVMKEWTIAADYGHALIQTILSKSSGDVLDVGSGISTLLAGYALEKRGSGKVIALEHEEKYFRHYSNLVAEHQLEQCISVYHCPLITHTINGESWTWYDISKVESLNNVNIISVDGPPGDLQKLSRYPALPLLRSILSKETVVLLDDGERPDEQKISERWRHEFGLEAEFISNTKGMFLFRQKS